MGFFSQKNFRGLSFWSQITSSLLLSALLVACGDDSDNGLGNFPKNDIDLSSTEEDDSSSSVASENKRSSSSSKAGDQDSLDTQSGGDEVEDGLLDVVYVLVDGTVSGAIALDEFAKSTKISMVQLDSADGYKETKIAFSGNVGKNGDYEIKKIDLPQPYVLFSVEGTIDNVVDGKAASVTLETFGDMTSGEVFNLNLLTTLEAGRAVELLKGENKASVDAVKFEAAEEVWNMFYLESTDFDMTETIHVSDESESGAALLAATVLLQAGADGDFAKFFKSVTADIVKDGKWDDDASRIAIADWALTNDLKDGYASLRKALEKRYSKIGDFEGYLKNFYLKTLEFPKCDEESVDKVFFVQNKSSEFYAADYTDVSKSDERFICDEKKGWIAIPDNKKDLVGDDTPAEDGEVRRGAFTGEFLVYDGSKKEWRKATAVEKDRYFVLASDAKEFVDIQDVYEGIKDDERVIFVLRHAERGDDTSKSGTLTSNGKKQSVDVGARLTKFEEDFVLGASEFLRAHQTVEAIAKGRGQQYEVRDTIPQLNDDWYNKNEEAVEKAKNECGGGWEVTSKYAYTGAYSTGANAAYYDLAERSVELIEDVLLKKYTKEKFVLLSSHDKLMVPLVAYCTNLQIELKKYENNGKWINYLAGVAIIVDKAGNRRYVPVRGLNSGYAN